MTKRNPKELSKVINRKEEERRKMADEIEPPSKKTKMEEKTITEYIEETIQSIANSTNNLIPIISKEYIETIPCIEVYTGLINNPKDISKAVLMLNEKCPLKDLQHLKRVRNKEIIITDFKVNVKNIEEFVFENLKEISEIFEDFKTVKVPAVQPKLKWQFEESNKIWPCNFHPNKYNERLFSGNFFDNNELSKHKTYMTAVFEVIRIHLESNPESNKRIGATIVVDPTIDSIVAVALDHRETHPLQHAAMLAIDKVARTQNGGSWDASDEKSTFNGMLCGISEELHLKLEPKFPNLKFGAKNFKTKVEGDASGPYLCTGYYVYTLNEPCVMCAMALVHSRAKRVFFCRDNEEDGALKSRAKLQTITSLNHHFEVFTGFL